MQPVIDYARPCMMAEKYLKELHEAMLDHDKDKAIENGIQAIVEIRLTISAIRHEKEKYESN